MCPQTWAAALKPLRPQSHQTHGIMWRGATMSAEPGLAELSTHAPTIVSHYTKKGPLITLNVTMLLICYLLPNLLLLQFDKLTEEWDSLHQTNMHSSSTAAETKPPTLSRITKWYRIHIKVIFSHMHTDTHTEIQRKETVPFRLSAQQASHRPQPQSPSMSASTWLYTRSQTDRQTRMHAKKKSAYEQQKMHTGF